MGLLDGQFGGIAGGHSVGPWGDSKDVMRSPRDNNTVENVGAFPSGTYRLAHLVQKKIFHARPGREPILLKPIVKNHRKPGFFDYTALRKWVDSLPDEREASDQSTSEDLKLLERSSDKGEQPPVPVTIATDLNASAPEQQDGVAKGLKALDALQRDRHGRESIERLGGAKAVAMVGFDAIRGVKDPLALACERALILELLLRELPGLDVERTSPPKWHASIDPEMKTAVEELLDIHHSNALTTEQFIQLIEALALGWPGVREDASIEASPEQRANAAGCVRALAELANRGMLPREVLSSFREYDAINRALLIRAQEREIGGKYFELFAAETELRTLQGSGKGKEKDDDILEDERGKLKTKLHGRIEELRADIRHIDIDFTPDTATRMHMQPQVRVEAMRKTGRKLGGLHADLMEAERSLRNVGIDIRGVRVDEHYVLGLMKKKPRQRRQIALMLARVAFIEDEIAKIDRHFKRRVETERLTRGQVRTRIIEGMKEASEEYLANAEIKNSNKSYKSKRHYPLQKKKRPWHLGEEDHPAGFLAGQELKDLEASGEDLLHYGITREDVLEMQLPSAVEKEQGSKIGERDKATIRNLAAANFMGPADVKLVNRTHKTVRKRIFDKKVGRTALRSATSRTTAQLGEEYLSAVYRWVTGKKDQLNLSHASESVKTAMSDRWRKVMQLKSYEKNDIQKSVRKINDLQSEIMGSLGVLDAYPNPREVHNNIDDAHASRANQIHFIWTTLGSERAHLLATMIRAAVLAARPQMVTGDDAKVEAIDTYDASRYRPQVEEILKGWGWTDEDFRLYGVLIENIVFSRAENSKKAPGTVTAKRLARWLKWFRQGPEAASQIVTGEEPGLTSRTDRAKAHAIDVWNWIAGHTSGIEIDEMNPDLVDRFITGSVPAISNFGKISLRTHRMVNVGFPIATGTVLGIPASVGGGSQTGIIIKRLNGIMEVRIVAGFVLNGNVAPGAGGAVGAGSGGGNLGGDGSLWETHGVTLQIPITTKDGKEDFSAVQSYLRSLLTGALPTTEEWAKFASNVHITEKSGKHFMPYLSGEATEGVAVDVPAMGKFSAGLTESGVLGHRWRWRKGRHKNAATKKYVWKYTSNTTGSGELALGASFGFEHAAGGTLGELGGGAVKNKTIAGISGAAYGINLKNTAFYDWGTDWDWDFITNVGSVRTAEEALSKCGKKMLRHFGPLLDYQTTLQNGETVVFRDAIEQALSLMRHNDGFLLQFVPRPEVKDEVCRHLRRIAQIRQQILPRLERPSRADKLLSKIKRRALEDPGKKFEKEIEDLEARIRAAKNPDNLDNYQLANVFIMPVVMQTDEIVMLNALGLVKFSDVGVRMHDTLVVTIPGPEFRQRNLQATEGTVAKRKQRNPSATSISSSSSSSSSENHAVPLDLSTPRRRPDEDAGNFIPLEQSTPRHQPDDHAGGFVLERLSPDEYVLETPPISPPSPSSFSSHVSLDSSTPRGSPIQWYLTSTRFRLEVEGEEETELLGSESSNDSL